jgi:hypothetical protein
MFKIAILIFLLALYAHLYLHFIVNPNNECSILHDINKEDVTNTVYVKQPFMFDASLLRKEPKLKDKKFTTEDYGNVYDLSYVSVPILEPYVRFHTTRKVVHFTKKKKWLDTNLSCRTFYRFHKGNFKVSCIHPKYKELVSDKNHLKDHPRFIRLTLHEDSILFLPAYWYVQIVPLEKDSIVDKIQYFTPLNQLANAISKITQ